MSEIRHEPYGIDDPYKPRANERFPRDPESGETVQVSFSCAPETSEAWVELGATAGHERVDAVRLSDGVWSAWLPPLAEGDHSYRIRARAGNADSAAGPFALSVAGWRTAATLEEAVTLRGGLDLRLAPPPGGGPAPLVRLRFPRRDVLSLTTEVGTAAPRLRDELDVSVAREGDVIRLATDAMLAFVDLGRLELAIHRASTAPDADASALRPDDAALRVPLAVRWLQRPDGSAVRFETHLRPARDGGLYGLGERFAGPDLRGRRWDTRVYEEYKEQGARTYLPVPFIVSERGWGLFTEVDAPALFDLRRAPYRISVDAEHPYLTHHLMLAETPYDVTAAFTSMTGPIALPPTWAYGPWMSANTWNDQAKAEAVVRRTRAEDVPATVLVLEAWSDESTFYTFHDASYEPRAGDAAPRLADFRFGGRWPDPKRMVDALHDEGLRLVLWQIPVLKKLDAPHPQHDADEATMLERRYAIREADGSPYRNRGWWFEGALVLDVTNPDARAWWFAKRRYLFDELGIDGFKTDGGEHLWGRDLRAFDGSRGMGLVNTFAQRYVDAYHAFVREAAGDDGLTFSRAGYTGAQRSPAHWAGDENSTWSGLRASILAGLSAGLAGISLWGFDIGGFSGEIPTVELYLRSTQVACFAPIMQYHSELHSAAESRDRTPWNIAERHGDPRALSVYRAYAKLRMRLVDYLAGEARHLAERGRPLMRLPCLAFPDEHDRLAADPYAYLFGRDLLVAPVLEKGAEAREVLLPTGDWIDLWSGATVRGGGAFLAPAPLSHIPVFVRAGSPRLPALRAAAAPFDADLRRAPGGA